MGREPGPPEEAQSPSLQADLLCRPLKDDAVEPGQLACWGPPEESGGARADAVALGGFKSRISGVRGVRGLQAKTDESSLEQNVPSRVTATT